MSKLAFLRSWATPLTMGAFVLMSSTGLMMFFHIDQGIMSGMHGWMSWTFVIGVIAHVTINFRPLKNHLKSAWGRSSVTIFAAMILASFFTWGEHTQPQLLIAIQNALVNVPLTTLADMTHTTPDALEQRLKAEGFVARKKQTIRDIAGDTSREQQRVLDVVFVP
jgi:hypothetical protein